MKSLRSRVKSATRTFAANMRNRPTETEAILWERLRLSRTGYKFRRQQIIYGFIVDFYCPSRKLAVEIDGGYHTEQTDHDAMRERKISTAGILIVRFGTDDVLDRLEDVVAKITAVCVSRSEYNSRQKLP